MKRLYRFEWFLLAVTLVLAPLLASMGIHRSSEKSANPRPSVSYHGTATLYHVVTERTFAGSVTNWLKARAQEFEKSHYGAHLRIEGMSEQDFFERIANGRPADGYSFFTGALYPELFQPLPDMEIADSLFRSGIQQNAYVLPYFFTADVLVGGEECVLSDGGVFMEPLTAARLHCVPCKEEEAKSWVLDLYAAANKLAEEPSFKMQPLDGFTDAVCYLGISESADEESVRILREFYRYLIEEESQMTLASLGALSVLPNVTIQNDSRFLTLEESFESVLTPDPFLWYLAYDALVSDAEAALSDPLYKERFQERFHALFASES